MLLIYQIIAFAKKIINITTNIIINGYSGRTHNLSFVCDCFKVALATLYKLKKHMFNFLNLHFFST